MADQQQLKREDLIAWIREHDLDPNLVKGVEIVPKGISDEGVNLRVVMYAVDEDGKRFICRSAFCEAEHEGSHVHWDSPAKPGDPVDRHMHAAEEVRWVPLRSFPVKTGG